MKPFLFKRARSSGSVLDIVPSYLAPDGFLCVHKSYPSDGKTWKRKDGWIVSHVKTGLALTSLTNVQRTRVDALAICETLRKLGTYWSFDTLSDVPYDLRSYCVKLLANAKRKE